MRFFCIKLLSLLLCAVVLTGVLPGTAATEEARYGYTTLDDDQKYVYTCLMEGIGQAEGTIELDKNRKISEQDLQTASNVLCSDYPEYFWYTGSYESVILNGTAVTEVHPQYTLNGSEVVGGSDELTAAKAAFQNRASQILDAMSAESDYEKALYLHDAIIGSVSYVQGSNDQSAYGALVDGNAVCAGYTRAYQYLLHQAGIGAWKVDGVAVNAQGGEERHSWLLMWIDGNCCYTDITWDDPGDVNFHAYFCLSLEAISADHYADSFFAERLTACEHGAMDYFAMSSGLGVGVLTDSTSAADAAACFRVEKSAENSDILQCSFRYDGADFTAWLNVNRDAVAQELKLVGQYQCSVVQTGKEYRITFAGTVDETPGPTEPVTDLPGGELPEISGLIGILVGVAGGVIAIVIVVVILVSRRKKQ